MSDDCVNNDHHHHHDDNGDDDAKEPKTKRLSTEAWKAKKKRDLGLKFRTPKRRATRRDLLEGRIRNHRRMIVWYRKKYERLIRKAGFEMKTLKALDD